MRDFPFMEALHPDGKWRGCRTYKLRPDGLFDVTWADGKKSSKIYAVRAEDEQKALKSAKATPPPLRLRPIPITRTNMHTGKQQSDCVWEWMITFTCHCSM